jgi:hypothetical protein
VAGAFISHSPPYSAEAKSPSSWRGALAFPFVRTKAIRNGAVGMFGMEDRIQGYAELGPSSLSEISFSELS